MNMTVDRIHGRDIKLKLSTHRFALETKILKVKNEESQRF